MLLSVSVNVCFGFSTYRPSPPNDPTPLGGFMGNKLYVGNLVFSATEQSLTENFSAFGTVQSAKIITDRDTGRSKGFGFVEYKDEIIVIDAGYSFPGQEMYGI